ncbi:MAG TPA: VWA domain-containing protein [Candidatus Acidoferrales bacterium]|jgi:VWFA-related protein
MKSLRQTLALAIVIALSLPLSGLAQQVPPPPPPTQPGQLAPPAAQTPQTQAQQQSQAQPQQQKPPSIVSRSEEVLVPVTVKSQNGDMVTSLRKEDFRILEDGVEQRITNLKSDPVPISAVILLDDSLKKKPQDELQASIRAIAGGFGVKDEAAIFRFDQFPQQLTDFISDPDELLTQLGRVQISGGEVAKQDNSQLAPPPTIGAPSGPGLPANPPVQLFGGNGIKSINDAVYAAAQLLRTRPHDNRKIIFLVSDGVDSRGSKYSLEDTVRMAQQAEAAVYSIGVGVPVADKFHTVLRTFAAQTGGDIFFASSSADLERFYSRIADQARNQYTLSYSPDHKDRVVTYHRIEVRVKLQNLTVEARQGYFSAPTP